mgnify:CR=1 FL=1
MTSPVVASVSAGTALGAEPGASSTTPTPGSALTQEGQQAGQQYDFGSLTSETLTTKAWEALKAGDHAAVEAYTNKCIQLYEAKAVQQASSLTEFAPKDRGVLFVSRRPFAHERLLDRVSACAEGRFMSIQRGLLVRQDSLFGIF